MSTSRTRGLVTETDYQVQGPRTTGSLGVKTRANVRRGGGTQRVWGQGIESLRAMGCLIHHGTTSRRQAKRQSARRSARVVGALTFLVTAATCVAGHPFGDDGDLMLR